MVDEKTPRIVLFHGRPLFYLDVIKGERGYGGDIIKQRAQALATAIGIANNIYSNGMEGKPLIYQRGFSDEGDLDDEMTNELGLADVDLGIPNFELEEAVETFETDASEDQPKESGQEELIPIFPLGLGDGFGFHPIVSETLDSLPNTPPTYLHPDTVQPLALERRPLEVCRQLEPLFQSTERNPITEMLRTSVRVATAVLRLERDGRFYYEVREGEGKPIRFSEF